MVVLGDLTEFRIETEDLTELGVVSLAAGDSAIITFDAIPDLELEGTLARIRPFGRDRLGDIVYTVIVVPDEQDERLKWNMTAVVDIQPQ